MADNDIIGFRINAQIVCALCGVKRPNGGFAVKNGPAPGTYCSAYHAQIASDEKSDEKEGDQ